LPERAPPPFSLQAARAPVPVASSTSCPLPNEEPMAAEKVMKKPSKKAAKKVMKKPAKKAAKKAAKKVKKKPAKKGGKK